MALGTVGDLRRIQRAMAGNASGFRPRALHGLSAFVEEFEPKQALVVCTEKEERVIGKIRVVPWKVFLARLWSGEYLH
jgi:hypothetical protein